MAEQSTSPRPARRQSDRFPTSPSDLTERELRIAQLAARLAVEQIQQEFYTQVGKNVVTKGLVLVGMLAVAFAAGKGFITWK